MNSQNRTSSFLALMALVVLLFGVGAASQPTKAIQQDDPTPIPGSPSPDLSIDKTVAGDLEIRPGQTVTFMITVRNNGDETATNVKVKDDFDQLVLPTIKVLPTAELPAGAVENNGDVITWDLGEMKPGEEIVLSYEATATEAFPSETAMVKNVSSVSANGVEIDQSAVELAVKAAQLTLARELVRVDGEGEIGPGDTLRHVIRYGNSGTTEATNVMIEETFDATVVQSIENITNGGQQDGATLRWNLGTVSSHFNDIVSYEAKLKTALSKGTIEVASEAVIRADDLNPVSASEDFALRTPRLIIERVREDLNGGVIEPGDSLRFTIRFKNKGEVSAQDVLVRDDFEDWFVAEVSNISPAGQEVDGSVEWTIERLDPEQEEKVSYEVRLIGDIGKAREVTNTALIFMSQEQVNSATTTMTIEPQQAEAAEAEKPIQFKELTIAVLAGVLGVFAMGWLGGLSISVLKRNKWQDKYFSYLVEGLAMIVIVEAVLILALGSGIKQDGAVSILSGIAGYVLGRSRGGG